MNDRSANENDRSASTPLSNPYAPPLTFSSSSDPKPEPSEIVYALRVFAGALFFIPAVLFCSRSVRQTGGGSEILTLEGVTPGIPFVAISLILVSAPLWKCQSLVTYFVGFLLLIGNTLLLARVLFLIFSV